jgi:hypothetical protein
MLDSAFRNVVSMKHVIGKQRSANQLTGETGQEIFSKWATQHRLSATKPKEDYGIDFLCHIFRNGVAGGQILSGGVLAVQVRSTSVKAGKQRVKLSRDDAEVALRSVVPYLLVGVDVPKERIYFRFLDDGFMVKLRSFLVGHKKSLSWPLEKMENGEQAFYRHLDEVCQPGHQHRLRLTRAKLDIAAVMPGSKVSYLQTDNCGIARVRMPLITAAFDIAAGVQEEATKIVFEKGEIPTDAMRFPPHPAILPLAELVNGIIVLEGPMERALSLSIRLPDRAPVTITAAMRSIGDEMGYVLRSGLYLTFSAARRKGKEFVHEFDHGIVVKCATVLADVPDEMEFLKALRDGAMIKSETGPEIPIEHWGNLRYLGPDLQRIEKAMAHFALPMGDLRLADVVARSFLMGADVAAAFMDGVGIDQICPGFLFEEPLNGAEPKETHWHPCAFEAPIVMNLGKSGLIIWSGGVGSVCLANGLICGFRAERQDKWRFEKRGQPFAEIDGPELWLYNNWPGIPLGATGKHEAKYRGVELPVAATITYESITDGPDDMELE